MKRYASHAEVISFLFGAYLISINKSLDIDVFDILSPMKRANNFPHDVFFTKHMRVCCEFLLLQKNFSNRYIYVALNLELNLIERYKDNGCVRCVQCIIP